MPPLTNQVDQNSPVEPKDDSRQDHKLPERYSRHDTRFPARSRRVGLQKGAHDPRNAKRRGILSRISQYGSLMQRALLKSFLAEVETQEPMFCGESRARFSSPA